MGSDVIAGTMGAVDDDFDSAQVQIGGKCALAELDVASGGVIDAACLAQRGRGCCHDRVFQPALYLLFGRIGQLFAARGEELDAVIFERVVGSADDDTRLQAQGTGQVSDCGGRERPAQVDVDSGGRQARLQGGFQHVAGDSGVFADQDRRRVACARVGDAAGENLTGRVAEVHHKLGGNGQFSDFAAHTVGAEVFSS